MVWFALFGYIKYIAQFIYSSSSNYRVWAKIQQEFYFIFIFSSKYFDDVQPVLTRLLHLDLHKQLYSSRRSQVGITADLFNLIIIYIFFSKLYNGSTDSVSSKLGFIRIWGFIFWLSPYKYNYFIHKHKSENSIPQDFFMF